MTPNEPGSGPGDDVDSERSSLDDVFRLLGHAERRRVLSVLADLDSPEEGVELSELEASDEAGPSRTDLYHRHLPKLSDAGYVTWRREADVVARGPRFADVVPVLDLLRSNEGRLPDEWP
jgi:DNA-binding transcriptional ArsR family regulator